MSWHKQMKTEHAGAKNGGGWWGPRLEAKIVSRKVRRQRERRVEHDAKYLGRTIT